MQLAILGQTSKDKGTQLERLVALLLEDRGYIDPVVNFIGTGGLEIDLYAKRLVPGLSGDSRLTVLCECKAHKEPINTTDWLNFLGKLHYEELKQPNTVYGCFIALSGVNGNVAGMFEEIKKNKSSIELVTGQELRTLLLGKFNACEIKDAKQRLAKLSSRSVIDQILCYYNEKIYWTLQLEDDCFVVLDSKSREFLRPEHDIVALIEASTSSGTAIDIIEERRAVERKERIQKLLLAALLIGPSRMDVEKIIEKCNSGVITTESESITSPEVLDAAQPLAIEKLVDIDGVEVELVLPLTTSAYSKLLSGITFASALSTDTYLDGINEQILSNICSLQGKLQLSEENRKKAVFILKHSPSAFAWALVPNSIFTTSQEQGAGKVPEVVRHSEMYFMRTLAARFRQDFSQSVLTSFYHTENGLVEFESDESIKIKSKCGVELELHTKERHGIGQMSEEHGGSTAFS